MGLIQFVVHPPGRLKEPAVRQCYFAGPDLVPWPSRNRLEGDRLLIERADADSGCLFVPWPVEHRGQLVLSTGTLMARERPYHLPHELARGTVNRVRMQLADWQEMGLQASDGLLDLVRQAIGQLAHAASGQDDPQRSAQAAEAAIGLALEASDRLIRGYTRQALAARHRTSQALPTRLGVQLGPRRLSTSQQQAVARVANVVAVDVDWHRVEATEGSYTWDAYEQQLEWAAREDCQVICGPLLEISTRTFPDWLCLWEGDFENLTAVVTDYVETVVHRFAGRVNQWICTAWTNQGDVLGMSEEERLHLAVRSIEVTEAIDTDTPRMLMLNQPWGDAVRQRSLEFSPLQIADALVRSGLKLSSLGLRLDVGFLPGGTWPRHLMELSRLIELWSSFGLPLYVWLTYPSRSESNSAARDDEQPTRVLAGDWDPQQQARWGRRAISMLLAKPTVHGVVWGQLTDGGLFPGGGCLDPQGKAKPLLREMARLREEHLE